MKLPTESTAKANTAKYDPCSAICSGGNLDERSHFCVNLTISAKMQHSFLLIIYFILRVDLTSAQFNTSLQNKTFDSLNSENNSVSDNGTITEFPAWQKWLDNSQAAISVVGNSFALQKEKEREREICLFMQT